MRGASAAGRPGDGERAVRVASNNLFSRYGFEDGGSPDAWFDYWHDWRTAPAGETPDFPWGEVVRRYLLPALDQQVTVTEYGNHNPVRAVTVDGTDVTGCWDDGAGQPWPELTPPYVDVPLADVIALAGVPGAPPARRGGPAPGESRGGPAQGARRRRIQPVRTSRRQRRQR